MKKKLATIIIEEIRIQKKQMYYWSKSIEWDKNPRRQINGFGKNVVTRKYQIDGKFTFVYQKHFNPSWQL
jgi:hypothetical protein